MRCRTLVLALTVGLGGIASAQPGPPPQPPPPPVDTTTTTTTTTTDTVAPDPMTQPVQPVQPVQQPVVQVAPTESAGPRPDGMAMGLGVGYMLPTSLQTPNITSFRLRLGGGLT